MKKTLLGNSLLTIFAVVFAFSSVIFAQTSENQSKTVNFRYSQNPKTKAKPEQKENQTPPETPKNVAVINEVPVDQTTVKTPSIAKKTLEVAKKASEKAVSPTEIYKVGIGDVLFISLQNAPKSSTYFTVLNDGTIDYPLAGELVAVSGLTTEEIEDLLKEKIKLFENPQISVKVRDYSSKKISVLGLVERSGEKKLQREAIPLFVVRAEAIVQPKATKAVIKRANSTTETIDLKDKNADAVLIFPDDIVEFTGENEQNGNSANLFYYIAGEINSGGQKEFYNGITLTQSIIVSGGLKKPNVKKVVIRRKNTAGLLVSTEYNLKAIRDGKSPDPVLMAGDTIEIGM